MGGETLSLPIYFIGNCPICRDYGMLEILFNFKEKKCSIMCEECWAEWNSPEDVFKSVKGFRKSYPEAEARTATIEEIRAAGWEKYIVEQRPPDPL